MLRLSLWVPVDDSDVCDQLTAHLRCVVLDEVILAMLTDIDEVLVFVESARTGWHRSNILGPRTIPFRTEPLIVTLSARLSSQEG